jgi:hypothetical protein
MPPKPREPKREEREDDGDASKEDDKDVRIRLHSIRVTDEHKLTWM